MKKLIVIVSLFFSLTVVAQTKISIPNDGGIDMLTIPESCGLPEVSEYQSNMLEQAVTNQFSSITSDEVYELPVKFHLLGNSAGYTGGLTPQDIKDNVAYINSLLVPNKIKFIIYGDIEVVLDDNLYSVTSSNLTKLRPIHVDSIPNVYIAQTPGVAGFAYLPAYSYYWTRDVIAVSWGVAKGKGTTIGHELGHWMGGYHTHGISNTANATTGLYTDELVTRSRNEVSPRLKSNADVAGDRVEDTPADPKLNVYWYNMRDANGDAFTPNVYNILSYAPSGSRTHFTIGQSNRFKTYLDGYRSYYKRKKPSTAVDTTIVVTPPQSNNSSNISLNAATTASNVRGSNYTSYAVDGITNSDDLKWVSNKLTNQWLEVDFGGLYNITRYELYSGKVNGGGQMVNFKIEYYDGQWKVADIVSNNTQQDLKKDLSTTYVASKVRVTCSDLAYHVVREFMLFGEEYESTPGVVANISQGKPITVSSYYQDFVGTKAVDGTISNDSRWISSKSDPEKSLIIDLQVIKEITSIKIYTGYGSNYPIKNFDIYYYDSSWKLLKSVRDNKELDLEFIINSISTSKIKFIGLDSDYIRLKEIQVFGK